MKKILVALCLTVATPAAAERSISFEPFELPAGGSVVAPVAAGDGPTGISAMLDNATNGAIAVAMAEAGFSGEKNQTLSLFGVKPYARIDLVGVDLYIITDQGIPKFTDGEFGPFKCEFISNRGTKVWPGFVSPDLLMVNWYRCRFMATREVQDREVNEFLDTLTRKGWWWSAAQKLWNYDGEAGFSKAY